MANNPNNKSDREEVIQEFFNNVDHQDVLLNNVQPTGTILNTGCGSFGRVEKVKYGFSIYAGKTFHDRFYEKTFQFSKITVNEFVKEYKHICSINHPNIVKAIGTTVVGYSMIPMLVSELLDHDLHVYLETMHNVTLVLKQSMLEDIGKGLLYLHSQSPTPIIHRDLTAHNVLLTSSLVAKISDIGNCSLADLAPKEVILVENDKVSVYMPPELGNESKKKCPSVDVFSYGHLVLFCCIQVRAHGRQ